MGIDDDGGDGEVGETPGEEPLVIDLRDGVDTVAAFEADAARRADAARLRVAGTPSDPVETP